MFGNHPETTPPPTILLGEKVVFRETCPFVPKRLRTADLDERMELLEVRDSLKTGQRVGPQFALKSISFQSLCFQY